MRIRLLGPVDVVDGPQSVALGGMKERTLLTVLALNPGEVVSTSRIVDALWGDDQPRTAAATLRSHISRVRRALREGGIALSVAPGGFSLRADDDSIDIGVVERLVAGARGSRTPEQTAGTLREALGHWRGPSLGDLSELPFASADATRLDEFRTTIFEDCMTAELRCGRHAAVAAELEATCEQHPFREGLWAARIIALYRCGRQAEALRAYGELRQRLVDDLGIDPSPALRRLEQDLLSQASTLDWHPEERAPLRVTVPERRLPVAGERQLVGRRREVSLLEAAWARAQGGHPEVVLLAGEPGIGKTRLALAAADLAVESGGVAVYGRCDEHASRPFGPLSDVAGQLIRALPQEDREEVLGPWASELAALMPDVVREDDARVPEVGERGAVFDAIAHLLAIGASRSPILVILDDMHWAGAESILLLLRVLSDQRQIRALIVGTYRDTEVDSDHPLADLLGEPSVARVNVEALGFDELAELTGETRRGVVQDILVRSGGNPFFALELAQHLADPSADHEKVPSSVRDLLRRRFRQLGQGPYAVLRLAAVVGREFEAHLLEQVLSDDDPDMVLTALDSALYAHLIEDRGSGRFAFVHDLVRDTLLSELTSARRARLHHNIADVLGAEPAGRQDLEALAHHTAEAVPDGAPITAAVDLGIRCARQAVRQLATERAAQLLERTMALVEGSSRPDRGLRCDIRLAQAELLAHTGQLAEVRELAVAASEDARAVGSGVRLARCARVHFGWGEVGQHDPVTVALCEEALRVLGEGEPSCRSEVLAVLAQVVGNNLGRPADAVATAEEALMLARRSGDLDALGLALVALDRNLLGRPEVARRLDVNDELIQVAGVVGDDVMRFAGMRQQAAARLELGDVAGFEAERRGMERLHERLGSWLSSFWISAYRVTSSVLAGRFDQAQHELDRLGEQLAGETNAVTIWAGMQAMLWRELGNAEELVPMMDASAAQFANLTIFRVGAASFLAEAGDLDAARPRYEALVADDLADVPRDQTFVASLGGLTETAVRLGDVGRAASLREWLEPYAGLLVITGAGSFCYGTVDRLLGMLLALEGRHAEAVDRYESALRTEAAIGADPFRVRTGRWLAASLLARAEGDDVERAADVLRVALDEAGRLGMRRMAAEVDALLDDAERRLVGRGEARSATASGSHG